MFGFGKKEFNASLLQPTGGLISGMFFSNPNLDIETTLFYEIQIDLAPFEYDGEQEHTCVQLDFITLPAGNYLDLENSTFNFPINPKDGYIDGSVYIAGMHNPFDVTQIVFKTADKERIEASFRARLLFEGDSIEPANITMETKLKFGGIEIHCYELSEMPDDKLIEFVFQRIDKQFFIFDTEARKFEWNR